MSKIIEKYRGKTINATFCEGCGITEGIYCLSLIQREYICPRCKKPMGPLMAITILSPKDVN